MYVCVCVCLIDCLIVCLFAFSIFLFAYCLHSLSIC